MRREQISSTPTPLLIVLHVTSNPGNVDIVPQTQHHVPLPQGYYFRSNLESRKNNYDIVPKNREHGTPLERSFPETVPSYH